MVRGFFEFQVYVKPSSPNIDVFELIDYFSSLPDGELSFNHSPSETSCSIPYPKDFSELQKYSSVIDSDKPVTMKKPGLFVKFYPETEKERVGSWGYRILDVKADLKKESVLEKLCSLGSLYHIPDDFCVKERFFRDNGSDFLNSIYAMVVKLQNH